MTAIDTLASFSSAVPSPVYTRTRHTVVVLCIGLCARHWNWTHEVMETLVACVIQTCSDTRAVPSTHGDTLQLATETNGLFFGAAVGYPGVQATNNFVGKHRNVQRQSSVCRQHH